MQHLNIPLKRHTKTTRPLRQVVWLLASLTAISAFLLWCVSTWWFSRSSILALAPTNTIASLELQVNSKTASFLADWLSGVPLISGRSLELRDLSPYTHGDLAIFVTQGGHRSVAIRAKPEDLPTNLLDQLSITIQEKGPFVLLSSTLLPIAGSNQTTRRPFLPSLKKLWIGRLTMRNDHVSGNVFLTDHGLELTLPPLKIGEQAITNVQNPDVRISDLTWDEDGDTLNALSQMLGEFAQQSIFFDENSEVTTILRSGETGTQILLGIKTKDLTEELVIRELQYIGAFARPTISKEALPDGSSLQEILIQPELVSVEQVSTSLGTSYRVQNEKGAFILGALYDETVIFSNNQELFEEFAQTQSMELSTCKGDSSLNPGFLMDQVQMNGFSPTVSLIEELLNDFSQVSIDLKKYSTDVYFCRS